MARMKPFYFRCILITLFIICEVNVNAKSLKFYRSRTSGHSYPSSHGLSGQSHKPSYPSSSGLSGSSRHTSHQTHSYPTSSSGLSGTPSSHGYPSASYPSSSGLSGTGRGTPSGSSYPPSHGLSGNTPSASYPHYTYPVARPTNVQYQTSNTHVNNNWGSNNYVHHSNTHNEVHHHHTNTHNVIHHHHYEYRPPRVIHYGGAMSYPVYTGSHIPTYVYQYRSSGSKYSMLLAGLALYNLGMVSASPSMYNYHKHYVPQPDEVCKFGVRYEYGSYDEMAIDCRAITNFIWSEQSRPQTVTVVNQTVVTTNSQTQTLQNGVVNASQIVPNNGAVVTNTVNTVTTTQTQTVNDPKYNGNPVDVSPGMECYVTRATTFGSMRKIVPCGLLNNYAAQSLRRNSGVQIKSSWILVMITIALRVLS